MVFSNGRIVSNMQKENVGWRGISYKCIRNNCRLYPQKVSIQEATQSKSGEVLMKFNYWYIGCFLLAIGFILIGSGTLLISLAGVLVIGGGLFSFFKELNKDESSQSKFDLKYWITANFIITAAFIMVVVARPRSALDEFVALLLLMVGNFLFFMIAAIWEKGEKIQ